MKKTVIVTEKYSVAETYAKVLGATTKKDGYFENDTYIITWCIGHLVTLSYPEKYDASLKKWSLENLPFLPEKYIYEVIPDVKHQFDVIKKLYNSDEIGAIYYAGDAGREGAYIQALVRQEAGRNPNVTEKMVWIDSQTEEEIKRGIREAKPWSDYNNIVSAGYERAIEDYASGINFSRLLTLKYGQLANTTAALEHYKPISVGRVMSCVLGMIVTKEKEVLSFVPTPYYKIKNTIDYMGIPLEAEWQVDEDSKVFESPLLYNSNGFKMEEDAIRFIHSLSPTVFIHSVEKTIEKKSAPLLFNLAELQNECSKRFKIAPDKTLAVAQSLYEKQMTTYPRTDARVLSEAIAKEIRTNLTGLCEVEEYNSFAETILDCEWDAKLIGSKYVDDSKITDHYAIIPTGEGLANYEDLTELEEKVYDLIVRRFLSVFYPAAEYFKVKVTEKADKETFIAHGKILNKKGYLTVAGKGEDDEEKNDKVMALSSLKEGAVYNATYECTKGETTPPKRYTSGSIIIAMENAGQLIEDEELRAQIKGSGIGTSATRAEIIKKLINLEYIALNQKTQILTPLPMGNILYEILDLTLPSVLNPKMTASWEKGLEQIQNGEISSTKYRRIMEDYIRKEAAQIIDNDLTDVITKRIAPFKQKGKPAFESEELNCPCPVCGGILKTTKYGCICSNFKKDDANACKFGIGEIAGVVLSKSELQQLISQGFTDFKDGFVSKSKKKFKAALTFTLNRDENGTMKPHIEFKFPPKEEPVETDVACFRCKAPMKKNEWNYECQCGYKLSHTIASKKVSEADIKILLEKKKTRLLEGFKGKNKKSFSAYLVLNDNGEIGFQFASKKR